MGVQINGDTGNVIATKGTFSGDVGIGGTLTYEDVTNIDSVGLITARSGIEIGASPGVAASISVDGNMIVSGITTINTVKVGGGVTISESGIEASGIGITCANINGTQIGGRRNKIVNGAMQVAQRGTSFTVSDDYTLDRYKFKITGGGACTITQDSTTPDDFSYSYKVDVTTADTSVASNDHGVIMYVVEGYDFAPANFGSSAAKTCTLSFYVRSNKTGTYGVAFQNASQNRSCIQEYTINSADTWERKSITIPADTGGSWNTTNGVGLKITWGLMGGSAYATSTLGSYNGSNVFLTSNQVNLFDNTSNEWYMTGAQVEIGSQATAFEHRSFGEELTLCQRYYFQGDGQELGASLNNYYGCQYGSNSMIKVSFPTTMRAKPTVTTPSSHNGGGSFSSIYENFTEIAYYITGDTTTSLAPSEVKADAEL